MPTRAATLQQVMLLHEDRPEADRALAVAAMFARAMAIGLTVLVHAASDERSRALEAAARETAAGAPITLHRLKWISAAIVCASAGATRDTLLVLSTHSALWRDEHERRRFESLDQPLLVVR